MPAVLINLSLHGMDGWTAARKLKTNPKAVSNPLLALTAHSLPSGRNPTFESGYIGFISKPINIQSFAVDIAQAVRIKKMAKKG